MGRIDPTQLPGFKEGHTVLVTFEKGSSGETVVRVASRNPLAIAVVKEAVNEVNQRMEHPAE